jgi:hypothetical protein
LPLSASALPSTAVQRVNPLEDTQWDARMATYPSATFFHGAAWARVLHDTYGFSPVYFALSEAGHLPALLPMMEVDSWLTGRRGISLPFTDECAPLCSDADSFHRLFHEVRQYAKDRAWKYVEVRGGRTWFGDAPASTSFWGHRLDLRADEETLFARVEGSVRRAVRKAEQSGLTVEFSQDLEAVRAFHELLCLTRKHHGVPPQPFRFFQNIHRHILTQNHGWVALARHAQVPVAGAVFFHFGASAIYKYGASDDRYQHLRANNLVMWQAIKRYAVQGFSVLDFGRTSLGNEGLRRFKLGWGTTERPIDYVRHDPRTGGFVTAKDESSGWHNRVFRLLPIPISRMIGAAFYRHVA